MSYWTRGTRIAFDAGYCCNVGNWNIYKKDYPVYDNDISNHSSTDLLGDDKDFFAAQWAWSGQAPTNNCDLGIERTFTNNLDYFSFDQGAGDRWDAWNVGYNEVFSPYSSPSTNTWDNPANQNSGIFIYLSDNDPINHIATLNIYKVDENHDLNWILAQTPPSRPMGLTMSYTECDNNYLMHPILTWKHNREPDMIDPINHPGVKRYKILRAISNFPDVPGNYQVIADTYFDAIPDPTYTDYSAFIECSGIFNENKLNIRYKVIAVDKDEWPSVPSDFVYARGISISQNDNIGLNNNLPKDYSLYQNYPNPFNPSTNIKYDIPKDNFVSVKIYDVLGREIKTLVNDFKKTGSYIVTFNGSEFASGVYFYRIQAGSFVSVKRMVLIK